MNDLEPPRKSALFDLKRREFVISSKMRSDLHEWFVPGNYHEVGDALCEVARLL